jgi:hypothetical protein
VKAVGWLITTVMEFSPHFARVKEADRQFGNDMKSSTSEAVAVIAIGEGEVAKWMHPGVEGISPYAGKGTRATQMVLSRQEA